MLPTIACVMIAGAEVDQGPSCHEERVRWNLDPAWVEHQYRRSCRIKEAMQWARDLDPRLDWDAISAKAHRDWVIWNELDNLYRVPSAEVPRRLRQALGDRDWHFRILPQPIMIHSHFTLE
jgi:hypothetical protein